jgi:hypothetical protein
MYTYTWKKYLPVIRLLLKRSVTGDQMMNLNRIDFEKGSRARKPSCSFEINVNNGRLQSLKAPAPAKDLMDILMADDIAKKLLRGNHYMITLNSDFELRLKHFPAEVQEELANIPPTGDQTGEPVTDAGLEKKESD